MPLSTVESVIILGVLFLGLMILHWLALRVLRLVRFAGLYLLGPMKASRRWVRDRPVIALIRDRYPRGYELVRSRVDPHGFSGLPLTLIALFAIYLITLFGGLIEELHEAEGLVALDNAVNDGLGPWRIEPFTDIMLWLTQWGNGAGYTIVGLVASLLWWNYRREYLILPFWITVLGAQITTWTAKYWIARQRPTPLELLVEHSPSFPSGHASASISVYGFLAYSIWRTVEHSPRGRFEVVFWGAVAIVLIGFSRIFLGVHYLSDVASGYILGGFWLVVGVTITEWHAEHHRNPLRPKN
jgi:membrane-associated phospholipid phosphatase